MSKIKPIAVIESEDHGSECMCGNCGWTLEIYEEA
tara:strand:+ start:8632 stop:8736 length:105 start_codon:yes stop_codon:yes gene_type:complete